MTDPQPAELEISTVKPSFWRNLSFVWLVPVLALAISLGLAWKSFANRGVLIEITFLSASGVTPGDTTLRYRDVVIGTVEQVTFTNDLSHVLVRARVDKDIAPYLDAETQFWVVRPQQVSAVCQPFFPASTSKAHGIRKSRESRSGSLSERTARRWCSRGARASGSPCSPPTAD